MGVFSSARKSWWGSRQDPPHLSRYHTRLFLTSPPPQKKKKYYVDISKTTNRTFLHVFTSQHMTGMTANNCTSLQTLCTTWCFLRKPNYWLMKCSLNVKKWIWVSDASMATYHNDISTKFLIACSRYMLMSGGGGDGGGVKGGQPMTTVQDCFSTFINVIPLDIFGWALLFSQKNFHSSAFLWQQNNSLLKVNLQLVTSCLAEAKQISSVDFWFHLNDCLRTTQFKLIHLFHKQSKGERKCKKWKQ